MDLHRVVSRTSFRGLILSAAALGVLSAAPLAHAGTHSVAREWNEMLLESIRKDLARPPVHARNLYHMSVAMWDAWATYDLTAQPVIFSEKHPTADPNIDSFRNQAISHAAYNLLRARFANAAGAPILFPQYDALMVSLGYNPGYTSTVGNSPAAIGNRIAVQVLAYGLGDGANEAGNYANQVYAPLNPPLVPPLPGNPTIIDPNRWQPLALDFFIDQSGQVVLGGYPAFIGAEWGNVKPFSMTLNDLTTHHRDGFDWKVYHDPGDPPYLGTSTGDFYKYSFEVTAAWSAHLDPSDGVMIDISPASLGAGTLPAANTVADYQTYYDVLNGGDNGTGYPVNPVTGLPYAPNIVPRGDYTRVLAEFWADGPNSETPPGHWFSLLNYVSDHPLFVKKLEGTGPVLGDLEWDVKSYLALGGAMHDTAIACWGTKGAYDFVRPISAIRYMCDLGQCTDPMAPSFHPNGINLIPGRIELVTPATTAPGQKHEHLAGFEGKIALLAWRGPPYIINPATDVAGVGWILAESWWPYQRPTFVTPPFAGYTSGHSTYSRVGARILDRLTGSPYFPGGLGEFFCPQNQYLVFEDGPSVNVTLQWATYYDASDQSSMSRIWGGIHPPCDDIPARKMGDEIAPEAFNRAKDYWTGAACDVAPEALAVYGTGCAGFGGVTPRISVAGCPVGGGSLVMQIADARPQTTALLMVGFIQSQTPLAGTCSALVAPLVNFLPLPVAGTPGVAGSGFVSLASLLPAAVPGGSQIKFQALIADAANPWGYSATNGASVTFH